MIFYFSGTGNTRWMANELARLIDDTTVDIPHYIRHPELHPLDTSRPIGICFPVYGWDAPHIVYDFITTLERELDTYPPYLYYICTMGDDIGCTGERLQSHCAQYGWQFDAGFSLLMPDTYVCLPSFDVDPDEERAAKLQAAPQRLTAIADAIRTRQRGIFQLLRGKRPWLKTYVWGRLFHRFLMTDRKFHTTDACVGCGRCETVCPVHNIEMKGGSPTWSGHCEMCLACYHACPHHALHWGNATLKKGQYKAPV